MKFVVSDDADDLFRELNNAEPARVLSQLAFVEEAAHTDSHAPVFEYDTDHNHAWYLLGLAYEKMGDNLCASKCFLNAIDAWPDDASSYVAYSNVEPDPRKIPEVLRSGVVRTNDYRINFNLANTYMDLGKPDKALEALRRIKLNSENRGEVEESIRRASKKVT